MLQFLMLHYLLSCYLLFHYLMFHYVNVAQYYATIFSILMLHLWFCTILILNNLMLHC